MRHDNVAGGKGMGDQEVVGTGQKGADGRWLIMLAHRPLAYHAERLRNCTWEF